MESQDPISIENQEQNPDNVSITPNPSETNVSKPENDSKEESQKLSAAEIVLQKLSDEQSESLEQIISEVKSEGVVENSEEQPLEEDTENSESTEEQPVINNNYAELSKEELVEALKVLVQNDNVQETKNDIESIKSFFYKKLRAELAENKQKFIDEGGEEKDYKAPVNPSEEILKQLYNQYRDKRDKIYEQQERQKEENLKKKYEIISKIENLINSQETMNQTFEEFKSLQKQWSEIGHVPQAETKKLWDSYNYQVEKFYDFVKINKELRDLDLKKNTDMKISLCEKAEELLLEPKIIKAFKELQKLHEQWREIGPALSAHKEELWERFKQATTKINKSHQEYYENIKKEQENNLKAKELICEKAEDLIAPDYTTRKEWENKSKEILELQKIWKLIGFAPKKFNNKIYERFRNACDKFFDKKRDFYSQNKEEEDNNLQLKEDLCVQAEGLKDSTDWKKTSEIYINLQKKWKTIGPVARKHSEEIWQRFRSACNAFFEKKQQHFSGIDQEQEANLKLKNQIIEEIENFQFADSDEKNLAALKEIQKRWSAIGFVPIKQKDELQERYRKAIDTQFNKLNIDEAKRNEVKVKNLIETVKNSNQAYEKLRAEKERLKNKVDGIMQKITLAENNLGFFAKSKSADSMIEDFKKKMEKSKNEVAELNKLIGMLSRAINDLVKKENDKK
ncbi:MAG: DUF349 domain-containing protein [Bacteroidales bacterium]|nr:DUF349 domain-containing protein [Bacteroidales bacterium]